MKKNCWEIKQCGRCQDGDKVEELGVCPVCQEDRLDGVHGGRNAGRACWVVAGTLCNNEAQGNFARKYGNCSACDVYRMVKEEEGGGFQLSATLLGSISKKF